MSDTTTNIVRKLQAKRTNKTWPASSYLHDQLENLSSPVDICIFQGLYTLTKKTFRMPEIVAARNSLPSACPTTLALLFSDLLIAVLVDVYASGLLLLPRATSLLLLPGLPLLAQSLRCFEESSHHSPQIREVSIRRRDLPTSIWARRGRWRLGRRRSEGPACG